MVTTNRLAVFTCLLMGALLGCNSSDSNQSHSEANVSDVFGKYALVLEADSPVDGGTDTCPLFYLQIYIGEASGGESSGLVEFAGLVSPVQTNVESSVEEQESLPVFSSSPTQQDFQTIYFSSEVDEEGSLKNITSWSTIPNLEWDAGGENSLVEPISISSLFENDFSFESEYEGIFSGSAEDIAEYLIQENAESGEQNTIRGAGPVFQGNVFSGGVWQVPSLIAQEPCHGTWSLSDANSQL